MKVTNGGYTVSRNGVTMSKPDDMDEDHWFANVAPRVGKSYATKSDVLFGHEYPQPTHGEDERGDGCDGGACAI